MSYPAITWAFAAKLARSCDKLLLVALASRADEQFICYPSQAKLAADTALNRKTVISCLVRLTEMGLILDTGLRKGATAQVTVYRLLGVAAPVVHYTYRTSDPYTGEFYLGKRSFDGDPEIDTYRGSGKWVLRCRQEGRLLVREVIARFDTSSEALVHEQWLFRQHQHDPLCMNDGTPLKISIATKAGMWGTNSPDSGTVRRVPFLPGKGPVFTGKESRISLKGSQKRDTESPEHPLESPGNRVPPDPPPAEPTNPKRKRAAAVPPAALEIPDWIPKRAWNDYVEGRRQNGKAPTPIALERLIDQLDGFRQRGVNLEKALDASTIAGWSGVFEPKRQHVNGFGPKRSAADQNRLDLLSQGGLLDEITEAEILQ